MGYHLEGFLDWRGVFGGRQSIPTPPMSYLAIDSRGQINQTTPMKERWIWTSNLDSTSLYLAMPLHFHFPILHEPLRCLVLLDTAGLRLMVSQDRFAWFTNMAKGKCSLVASIGRRQTVRKVSFG